MSQQQKIATLVNDLREVAQSSDEARNETIDALRSLGLSLETKSHLYYRIEQMGLELTVSRIAQDLNIYQALVESSSPLNSGDIATKANITPLFARRVLRYLASVGQIKETGVDTFTANDTTKVLATPGYKGLTYHAFDNIGPVLAALPEYLEENKYQEINNPTQTPAQKAFNTPLPMFAWLPTQPKRFGPVQQTMGVIPTGEPWFNIFPFKEQLGSFAGETVFVDLGGGFGHQSLQLLGAFPELKDKIVLQELEQTLAHLPPLDGVKATAHDFFTEQPIKGAKFYYLRHILHDWPEERALAILARVKEAMGPESQLLIDEIVMPNSGAHEQATTMDLIMMSSFGSLERTVNDWNDLLTKAGFKILRTDTHQSRRQNSIIQAVPV